jgi:hypothetical protein
MILLVVLDLHRLGRDREAIRALCDAAGDGCFSLRDSAWLLDTEQQPKWWRDRIRESGDVRDRIFVSRLQRRWAALQLDDATEWLSEPGRRW